MLPALGETSWEAAVVERERSVAGDVLWRNGHMDLDWRKRASMLVNGSRRWKARRGYCEVRVVWISRCRGRRGKMEWKRGLWVDTNHFICGPDAKLNGRASASNGRVMIGCCRFSMPTPS
jgi:hypothetical protein